MHALQFDSDCVQVGSIPFSNSLTQFFSLFFSLLLLSPIPLPAFSEIAPSKGYEISQEDKPLYFRLAETGEDFQKLKELVLQNPMRTSLYNEDRNTIMHIAAASNQAELLAWLVTLKDVTTINFNNYAGKSPLFIAAEKGHAAAVQALLKHPEISCNFKTKYYSPLTIACKNGHLEVVRVLLQDPRVDVNLAANQSSALSVTCMEGRLEILEALLQHPKLDINRRETKGGNALYQACLCRKPEIVRRLLLIDNLEVNAATATGVTALLACSQIGNFSVANLLLQDLRINVNLPDKNGKTPLFWAAKRGYYTLFFAILISRLQIDLQPPPGETFPKRYNDFILEYQQDHAGFRSRHSDIQIVQAESRKRQRRSLTSFEELHDEDDGDHQGELGGGEGELDGGDDGLEGDEGGDEDDDDGDGQGEEDLGDGDDGATPVANPNPNPVPRNMFLFTSSRSNVASSSSSSTSSSLLTMTALPPISAVPKPPAATVATWAPPLLQQQLPPPQQLQQGQIIQMQPPPPPTPRTPVMFHAQHQPLFPPQTLQILQNPIPPLLPRPVPQGHEGVNDEEDGDDEDDEGEDSQSPGSQHHGVTDDPEEGTTVTG